MIKGLPRAKSRGFTLIEMLVYTAIIAGVFALVLSGMIGLYQASRSARLSRTVNVSAVTALERVSREIRDSESVVVTSSTLGTSPGVLTITTDNASAAGGSYEFSLADSQLQIEDSAGAEVLTSSEVEVTELVFWHSVSANGEAVRVKLTARAVSSSTVPSRTYYSTVVLRESYE